MRLWVSDLDTYQRYKDNEEITLEECLKDLRRERLPTPAMAASRTLHSALEHSEYDTDAACIKRDGFTFHFECDINLAVPAVRELKGEVEMLTTAGSVTLVGKVDAIDGSIGDYKLTQRFDAERMADSWQWRSYLEMFNGHRFEYRVFVAKDNAKNPHEWVIKEYHEVPFYRYPSMGDEVRRYVDEFARFARQYLPARR